MTNSGEAARLQDTILPRLGTLLGPMSVGDGTATIRAGAQEFDDCAVIGLSGNLDLVVGSDYVRGVKFSLFEAGHLDYYDLGVYLVAANISDVAAMCARPLALLTVIRFPPEMSDEEFDSLVDGIAWACARYGVSNVGGDLGSAERLVLSASAIGLCPAGTAVSRSGARVGDIVYLSGPVGTAAAAMAYFLGGERTLDAADEETLLVPWRRAEARTDVADVLAGTGGVTACVDTSDGLNESLQLVATASSVGLEVEVESLPVLDVVATVAGLRDLDPLSLAISTSVDFELLFTVGPGECERVDAALAAAGLEVAKIGTVVEGAGVSFLRRGEKDDGRRQMERWDHDASETFVSALLRETRQ